MIKIKLEKWERAIIMQILEQDDGLRDKNEIYSNGDMLLKSVGAPEITNTIIFIRGKSTSEDYRASRAVFDTNEARDKHYDRIVKLFEDYNNREKKEKLSENNIFILE
jgi:hypothetical protein